MSPQEQLLLIMAGSSIFTVGLLSVCVHFATALSRDRILLWFGLFAAPYGFALILHGVVIPQRYSRTELVLLILGRLVGVAAIIPALVLFREFYGRGWKLSSSWLIWLYSVAVVSVFTVLGMREPANVIPSPGITLVILLPLVLLVDWFAGYRPPPTEGRAIIFTGLGIFFLAFAYDHIYNFVRGDRRSMSEPVGFFILTICLGYVFCQRVARNEAEWISMGSEMQAARKIQAAILPAAMPRLATWSVAARYAPMTAVAGDFYGFPHAGEESMEIIVADAMGHGVPAALVASMVKVCVFSGYQYGRMPNDIIGGLNTMLCEEVPGEYVTAVYVSLSREMRTGWYTAAGHPPPLLWHSSTQALEGLDNAGLLLGVRRLEGFATIKFQFEKGDRLLLYSDGLTEAENVAGFNFQSQLPELFASRQDHTAEEFADALLKDVLAWTDLGSGPCQSDDITFVVVDLL
jgi:phosphoserine phosphatase RsbU/P